MSDDTTTQPPKEKSTSQHQCSQGSEHRCVNLHLVFWLMLMTPSMVSFLAIWLLANMSHRGLESVSTQVGSVRSTVKSGVVKFNTQVLSLSSKSLKQLSDAALKMASEVDQQLSTSQSGTKK